MPVKSAMRKAEESRALDRIALPLIEELGIAAAYKRAIADCDAASAQRFPVTSRGKREAPLFTRDQA